MIYPITYFDIESQGTPSRYIEVILDSEESLNVEVAKLKYDKKHALTFEIDDGLNDIYKTHYSLFTGEGVPEFDTVSSDGFYFSDGCGNNFNYRANSNAWVFSQSTNIFWFEWSDGSHWLNYNQLDTIVNEANFGIYSHGYYKDMDGVDANPVVAAKSFSNWAENRYGNRPLYMNRPGGVTFDDTTWVNTWYDKGVVFHTMLSDDKPHQSRLDNFDFSSATQSYQVGRSSLENRTTAQMKVYVDDLMSSEGNQWRRTYGHRVETNSFVYYDELKGFVEYIDSTYGLNGNDSIWIPNINEIASYMLCRDYVNVSVSSFGNRHIISIDDSNLPYYITDRSLTLKISSNATVNNIKSTGFTTSHNNLNLINISWNR